MASAKTSNVVTCQNGAEIISGTSGAVTPAAAGANFAQKFGMIVAIGTTNVVIGAITCKIAYATFPITVVPGQPLPAPGCSSVTPHASNTGIGLAVYE